MLTYIQNSKRENAVDEATKKVDSLVSQIKGTEEVRYGYMTYGQMLDKMCEDRIEAAREEAREEALKEVRKEAERADKAEAELAILKAKLRELEKSSISNK